MQWLCYETSSSVDSGTIAHLINNVINCIKRNKTLWNYFAKKVQHQSRSFQNCFVLVNVHHVWVVNSKLVFFFFAAYTYRIWSFSVYVCSTWISPFSLQSPLSVGRTGQHCQLRQDFYMLLWRIISMTMLTVLVVCTFMLAKCWTRYPARQGGAITLCGFL